MEESAIDLSLEPRRAPADGATRPVKMEYVEGNGAIESPLKAQGAPIGNAIIGQRDNDKGDRDESGRADGDDGTCLDDVSTPLTDVTEASSDIPDTESDT